MSASGDAERAAAELRERAFLESPSRAGRSRWFADLIEALAAENAELRATVARVEAVASAGWPHVGYSDLRAALRPPDSEADRG